MSEKDIYFKVRNVDYDLESYYTPRYIIPYLPLNKDAYILDIGCGLGRFVGDCVINHGRVNIKGIDISKGAVEYCNSKKLPVVLIDNIIDFSKSESIKYDFILISHVLEHLEKNTIIDTLVTIKERILKKGGILFIAVPNAQSSTNSYWAYEDFTHKTLFTTGSLSYVLQTAGFDKFEFVDLDAFVGEKKKDKYFRLILLSIYKVIKRFERYITRSYYHAPSPLSFAYEIKVAIYND